MAKKQKTTPKTPPDTRRSTTPKGADPAATTGIPPALQKYLKESATPKGFVNPKPVSVADIRKRLNELNIRTSVPIDRLRDVINRIKPDAGVPEEKRPEDIRSSERALKPELRRFHGAKLALSWFPFLPLISSCADRFG